jgi:hypothetical protein
VFKASGVVNADVPRVPAAAAVDDGTVEIPATVKVFPETEAPSMIVPLAFSRTLQTEIDPGFPAPPFEPAVHPDRSRSPE